MAFMAEMGFYDLNGWCIYDLNGWPNSKHKDILFVFSKCNPELEF